MIFRFLSILILTLAIGGYILFGKKNDTVTPSQIPDYTINSYVRVIPPEKEPPLPDISGYTYDAAIAQTPAVTEKFKVTRIPLGRESFTNEYTEDTHKDIFAIRQNKKKADAVMVTEGVITLPTLAEFINDPDVLERQGDIFTLKMPLSIGPKATLIVGGDKSPVTLHLSSTHATFIANAGTLFFINASIIGWDMEKNEQHLFKDKDEYRPFLSSWHNAHMHMIRSIFESLGYANSKSYGITYSTNFKKDESRAGQKPPTGWIIENTFRDLYYGFYCYESADIPIIDNKYIDNIIYGIDPHDRSSRLIIARNETYGTKKKHGIIVSREVSDSWIFGNYSHHNHGSGIMIDRTSVRNVIASNKSTENEGDGLTLFESQDNTIWNNDLSRNGRVGLRVRNSWDVTAYHNVITDNKQAGVLTYSLKIEPINQERDYVLDPYTARAGLTVAGGRINGNKTGVFQIFNADILSVGPYDGDLNERVFNGDLLKKKDQLKTLIQAGKRHFEIRIVPETRSDVTAPEIQDDPQ